MAQDYVLPTASASVRELGFLVPPSDATKGRISLSPRGEFLLPPLGDWKNLPASPSPGTQADQAQGPSLDACNLSFEVSLHSISPILLIVIF